MIIEPRDLEARRLVPLDVDPTASLDERFEAFHRLNPWVLVALERRAAKWIDAGHKRCAIAMLVENLRYEYGTQTVGDAFKFNNSYRSRYVRLMVGRHPEWADSFETRELATASP